MRVFPSLCFQPTFLGAKFRAACCSSTCQKKGAAGWQTEVWMRQWLASLYRRCTGQLIWGPAMSAHLLGEQDFTSVKQGISIFDQSRHPALVSLSLTPPSRSCSSDQGGCGFAQSSPENPQCWRSPTSLVACLRAVQPS